MTNSLTTHRIKTAVLISGHGSNLQALIDACAVPDFPAEITLVISNVANVKGLERASAASIPSIVIPHGNYPNREAFDNALDAALARYDIELVCLAGFMRVLSDNFTRQWAGKLINIHPSLLPKYKGLNTHARALEAGDSEHGATVHWVTPELDSGEIIVQKSIPILAGDTPELLKQRVHVLEHMLYPESLRQVASGMAQSHLSS
ncbi:MAG: phosphoribosylglycinamide formyltransferase [Rickettsiales bacterium]|nr:phosphoribosylglycinamide formyltransferase [Rickettsiales bacterium]